MRFFNSVFESMRFSLTSTSHHTQRYEDDDKKQRERIDAKNGLENYSYSMKNTINDEKVSVPLCSLLSFRFGSITMVFLCACVIVDRGQAGCRR